MIDEKILKSVAGYGGASHHAPAMAEAVKAELAKLPKHAKMDTKTLLGRLGLPSSKPGDAEGKRMGQALWQLRKAGLLDGCWKPDPSRRFMGNPLILWHAPEITPEMF